MNYTWDFSSVFSHSDILIEGAIGTFKLAITALALAIPIGLVLAIMRMSPSRFLNGIASAYINFFRSSAALVLIFWFYFAFPILMSVDMGAYSAATLAITLQSAAYFAEVFRGGISSIQRGQWEAAKAIGMNYAAAMRFVILPQAVKRMLPIFFTRVIELIKTTALAAAIAYGDLLYSASRIVSITFRPIETYTVVALSFFVVIFVMSKAVRLLERRLAISD
ncbi:putative inner membrane amino-acid ABC transporter permease protein [Paraburkholderia piptadeniae]|uniref:Inner membrane amino-acid ABC transporter permease protein n=1 Tax=Paraburkholderia piptadeniae TaxID=1701573 RepID=A0A1N7SPP1_9BURK|nr:amino acid ABC transporter permease [Paraburkholderia piptadeniae]SIT49421.1 putative inner membrane amino-acid ABC transporter permease protein [Paraburkholderia piptadeniae]